MSDHGFAALDIGLAFGLVLGLAIWQLVRVKRSIRRDREEARRPPKP
ncbi:hypothetical protein [Methylobacterium sp. Leaf118]|nr:hypothetical protein [Methylobacterium sp. Leaf118]